MKKITLLLSAVLIFTLSFYSCEESQMDPTDPEASDFVETKPMYKINDVRKMQPCGEEQEECLIANGDDKEAGNIYISNDAFNLYVKVVLTDKFEFKQVNDYLKIDVVTDLPSERPPAGLFTYHSDEINLTNEAMYQIPLSDLYDTSLDCVQHDFNVLVHVDLYDPNGSGDDAYPTAWGGCKEGAKKNDNGNGHGKWWYYSEYTTECCVCWCGFGNDYQSSLNDYQNPDSDPCLSMMFNETRYIFWSNSFAFDKMTKNEEYTMSLLANPSLCVPQNSDGSLVDDERTAIEVGKVHLKPYKGEGDDDNVYFDVRFEIYDAYMGYNIQLDLYNGVKRIPKYDFEEKKVELIPGEQMIYQHRLIAGETDYTFENLPWLADGEYSYFSFHAAIGDCPMPNLLQNEM